MAALSTNFSTAFLGQKLYYCPQLHLQLYSRSSNRLSAKAEATPRCTAGRIQGYGRSGGSIRSAFERLPMDSSQNRKETEINSEIPPWVKRLFNFVELYPPTDDIVRRLLVFACVVYYCIANSDMDAMRPFGLIACIYFLYKKMRSLGKAFVIGVVALTIGVKCGCGIEHLESLASIICLFVIVVTYIIEPEPALLE